MTVNNHPPHNATLDTSIPQDYQFRPNDCHFPLPYQTIPSHVSSWMDCARWQIQHLQQQQDLLTTDVEDTLDDGFVLCDLSVVAHKLQAWRHLNPRIKPFFALKCNPDPMVAAVLSGGCAGFDCASLSEIHLAGKDHPSRIVYANPQRAESDLEESLRLGVAVFTLDGEEELSKIDKACQKLKAKSSPKIVIRLLVPDEHSSVPLGEKFGAPLEGVRRLVTKALSLQLPVIGVSFHCGSGCHDPQAYVQAIRLAKEAMEMINEVQEGVVEKCWLLDIGGGFPGRDGWKEGVEEHGRFVGSTSIQQSALEEKDDVETAAKIATAIQPVLDELFSPPLQIISEPGRYFVEAAFCLCSRIYRVSTASDDSPVYTIAQGVQGLFKDVVLCGETFHPVPLRVASKDDDDDKELLLPSTVCGPSGDAICKDFSLPKLQVGDWLLFDRMGAYTLSIAARSGRPPVRYVCGSAAGHV